MKDIESKELVMLFMAQICSIGIKSNQLSWLIRKLIVASENFLCRSKTLFIMDLKTVAAEQKNSIHAEFGVLMWTLIITQKLISICISSFTTDCNTTE